MMNQGVKGQRVGTAHTTELRIKVNYSPLAGGSKKKLDLQQRLAPVQNQLHFRVLQQVLPE